MPAGCAWAQLGPSKVFPWEKIERIRAEGERIAPATMVGGPRRRRFFPPARPLATIQTLAKWPKLRGLELAQNRPFTGGHFYFIYLL